MTAPDTLHPTQPILLVAGLVRGVSERDLARPASAYLAEVPWDERAPDPDLLDAESFLALL